MSSQPDQIDSTINIVTPENIAFQYQLAGPFRRFPAFVIDLAIRIGVYVALAMILAFALGNSMGQSGGAIAYGLMTLAWFIMSWFYGGLFETFWNGQTPGKWIMGMRVLTTEGQPINGLQAVMRNILRVVDFMPMISLEIFWEMFPDLLGDPDTRIPAYIIPTFLVGLISMTMTKRFQRLGDLVCGTIVVIEQRNWLTGVAKLEDPRVADLAAYLPADFQVTRTLAHALATYVDRRRFFSIPRKREVARHLGVPLIEILNLPSDTSHDLLLCALYYRTFVTTNTEEPTADNPYRGGPTAPIQDQMPNIVTSGQR